MEFVTNKVNFYYDPRRQGYDAAAWHTLSGAPAVAGTDLVLNNASALGKADIGRGEVAMSLTIPTAPTAGDVRSWGLAQVNLGALAVFRVNGTWFTAEVQDGYGSSKVEAIAWDSDWTNREIEYRVKYTPDGWHFYVAGVEKAFINEVFQAAVAATTQEATDTLTDAAHGLSDGQKVVLSYIDTSTGIDDKTLYYVVNAATNTFQVATTLGGPAVDIVGDGSCYYQIPAVLQHPKSPMSLYVSNANADAVLLTYVHVLDAEVYNPVSVTLTAGDIEIGAVELKDGASDTRAKISAANAARAATDNVLLVQPIGATGAVITGGGGSSASSGENSYMSPADFTATYTSATTLTLAGLTFAPTSAQFVSVKAQPASGVAVTYAPSDYTFGFNSMTGVLTVAGAAFGATDTFVVTLVGPKKPPYDSATASDKVSLIRDVSDQYVNETLVDTTNLTASTYYYPSTAGVVMDGYSSISIQGMTSGGVTTTIEATNDDASSPDWVDVTAAFTNLIVNPPVIGASYVDVNFALVPTLMQTANFKAFRIKCITSDSSNNVQYNIRRIY